MSTLFERLGGEEGIDKIMETFLDYFFKDPNCMTLFKNTELIDLKTYWKRFFFLVTGGDQNDKEGFSLAALREVQSTIYGDRTPSEDHFDAFTSVFEDMIKKLKWNEEDCKELIGNLNTKGRELFGLDPL